MLESNRLIVAPRSIFIFAAIVALGYAIGTEHVWEDYLITWKSSWHLATGQGLVYHVGERVHTFTSPLGVLLPALCSLLTFNHSMEAALWLFRVMCITAFAGAATMMYRTMLALRWPPLVALLASLWMMLDGKSIDCTINGMETALMLGFVSYALWTSFTPQTKRWLHLGLAWAGIMWTRPDGFIYIGALSLGVFLFNDESQSGMTRRDWLHVFVKAGLVCTILYLPWFIGAWIYYGSPVPNTVLAKGNAAGPRTLAGAAWTFIKLPVAAWTGISSIDSAYMPSNFGLGDWPRVVLIACRTISASALLICLIPRVPWTARIASFVWWVLAAYLAYFPGYPASWYLPAPAWFSFFALAGACAWICQSKVPRWVPLSAATCMLVLGLWLTFASAAQARVQQTLVDGGNRRAIGLWLKEHAGAHESVFMECLGYIGYYSEMKTLDFPGLSSREVVQAGKEVGYTWPRLIDELHPDWLVLRPWEAADISSTSPGLLDKTYDFQRSFDVSEQTSTANVYGHGLINYDSIFLVFHRKAS